MNIFLLFISMILMIGYYIMSSPSQNVAGQDTDSAIEMADLRSIADCVSAAHNAAMYCGEYTNECVQKYGIQSKIYRITSNGSLDSEHNCNDTVSGRVTLAVVTATCGMVVPDGKQHEMMDVLEKYYMDAGNFGLFFKNGSNPGIKTPGATEFFYTPVWLSGNEFCKGVAAPVDKNLTDGMLAYYSSMDASVESGQTPVTPNTPCPPGTYLVNFAGIRTCQPYSALCPRPEQYNLMTGGCCDDDMVYDEDTKECVNPWVNCEQCPEHKTGIVNPDTYECICVDSYNSDFCTNGIPLFNWEEFTWECLNSPEYEGIGKDCNYEFALSNQRPGAAPTILHNISPCNACETTKIVKDGGTCYVHCIPDSTKWNTRSCYSSSMSAEDCKAGDRSGVYFGFSKGYNTEGLKDGNGNDVVIDFTTYPFENRLMDRKFHCLKCNNRRDGTNSVFPYIANCIGGEASTASTSGGVSGGSSAKGTESGTTTESKPDSKPKDDGRGTVVESKPGEKTDNTKPVVLNPTTNSKLGFSRFRKN